MDFNVTNPAPDRWVLTDLLGRCAGRIERLGPGQVRIVPTERVFYLLGDTVAQTFENLDHALRAIEFVSRGSCRLKP